MAIDLNADVGTIIKDLLGKGKKSASTPGSAKPTPIYMQEPYRSVIISSVVIFAFLMVFVWGVFIPKQESIASMKQEIVRLENLQMQSKSLEVQIAALNKAMDKSRGHYQALLAQFSNSEDLGELYQSLSELALAYNLVVQNLKEVNTPIVPIKTANNAQNKKVKAAMEGVNGVTVDVELHGWYSNYIQFRTELEKNESLLAINTEAIEVGDIKKDQGKISVKLQISTYVLDKNPFYKAIGDDV